jgi:hypothetical protein
MGHPVQIEGHIAGLEIKSFFVWGLESLNEMAHLCSQLLGGGLQ